LQQGRWNNQINYPSASYVTPYPYNNGGVPFNSQYPYNQGQSAFNNYNQYQYPNNMLATTISPFNAQFAQYPYNQGQYGYNNPVNVFSTPAPFLNNGLMPSYSGYNYNSGYAPGYAPGYNPALTNPTGQLFNSLLNGMGTSAFSGSGKKR
jgi:hypothetical protein